MYLDFFGFSRHPFHVTPNPDFLFFSPTHKNALEVITNGVAKRAGIIVIIGDVGLGKTMVLNSWLAADRDHKLKSIVVFNPNDTFRAFLETTYDQLNRDFPAEADISELMGHFSNVLTEEYARGQNIALIIDEAQNLPIETLEQFVLLSRLVSSGEKLIQVLLIGQPELENKLNDYKLRELRPEIAAHATILPLTPEESARYIKHRISKVSSIDGAPFTRAAIRKIITCCEGIPRKINIVCDNALLIAFGNREKRVSVKIVNQAVAELYGYHSGKKRLFPVIVPVACLFLLAVFSYIALRAPKLPAPMLDSAATSARPGIASEEDDRRGESVEPAPASKILAETVRTERKDREESSAPEEQETKEGTYSLETVPNESSTQKEESFTERASEEHQRPEGESLDENSHPQDLRQEEPPDGPGGAAQDVPGPPQPEPAEFEEGVSSEEHITEPQSDLIEAIDQLLENRKKR